MFIWRRASPVGRASPSKRTGYHLAFTWEKPALLHVPRLARLPKSPGLTIFILTQTLLCVPSHTPTLFAVLHTYVIHFSSHHSPQGIFSGRLRQVPKLQYMYMYLLSLTIYIYIFSSLFSQLLILNHPVNFSCGRNLTGANTQLSAEC